MPGVYNLRRSSLCNFLQSPLIVQPVIIVCQSYSSRQLCLQVVSLPLRMKDAACVTRRKLKYWNGCKHLEWLQQFRRIIMPVSKLSLPVLRFECLLRVTLSLSVWSTEVLCWRVLLAVRCTGCYLTKRLHFRYQFRRCTVFRLAWVTGCGVFVCVSRTVFCWTTVFSELTRWVPREKSEDGSFWW
jgi:hypothetical protein